MDLKQNERRLFKIARTKLKGKIRINIFEIIITSIFS